MNLSGHFFFVQKKLPLEALHKMAGAGAAVHRIQRAKQFSQLEGTRWCTCRRALFLMTLLVKNGFKLFKSALFSAVLATNTSVAAKQARAQVLPGSAGRQGSTEAPKQVQMALGGA